MERLIKLLKRLLIIFSLTFTFILGFQVIKPKVYALDPLEEDSINQLFTYSGYNTYYNDGFWKFDYQDLQVPTSSKYIVMCYEDYSIYTTSITINFYTSTNTFISSTVLANQINVISVPSTAVTFDIYYVSTYSESGDNTSIIMERLNFHDKFYAIDFAIYNNRFNAYNSSDNLTVMYGMGYEDGYAAAESELPIIIDTNNDGYDDVSYNKGKDDGYAYALLDNDIVIDTNNDLYDDASYSAGYTSGLVAAREEVEATETIVGFAGSILGAGLSFLLFLGTEFSLFGINLLTVFIAFVTISLAIIILKKVIG